MQFTTLETTVTDSISTTVTITESTSTHMREKYIGCNAKVSGFAKANNIVDGLCHDHFNHIYCHFDEGDCCLPLVFKSECKICQCFDVKMSIGLETFTVTKVTITKIVTMMVEIAVLILILENIGQHF